MHLQATVLFMCMSQTLLFHVPRVPRAGQCFVFTIWKCCTVLVMSPHSSTYIWGVSWVGTSVPYYSWHANQTLLSIHVGLHLQATVLFMCEPNIVVPRTPRSTCWSVYFVWKCCTGVTQINGVNTNKVFNFSILSIVFTVISNY